MARSSFFIGMKAAVRRSTAARSPEAIISPRTRGAICQETPKRSLSQPQASASGTAESADQSRSTSAWSSQFTRSETASVKAASDRTLSMAMIRWPSMANWAWAMEVAGSAPLPSWRRTPSTLAPGKTEV